MTRIKTTVVISVITAALAGCGGQSVDPHNTDPRQGPMYINEYDQKFCDGSTLVYRFYDGGGSAVPNSPECS